MDLSPPPEAETETVQTSEQELQVVLDSLQEEAAIAAAVAAKSNSIKPQFATGDQSVTLSTAPPADSSVPALNELPAPPSPAVGTALGLMSSSQPQAETAPVEVAEESSAAVERVEVEQETALEEEVLEEASAPAEPQALLSVVPETSDKQTIQQQTEQDTTQPATPTAVQEKAEVQQAEQQQAMPHAEQQSAASTSTQAAQPQMTYWYVIPVMPYYPSSGMDAPPQQPIIMMPYSAPTGAPYHVVPQQNQNQPQPEASKKPQVTGSCSPEKSTQAEKADVKLVGKCSMGGYFDAYGKHKSKQP